MKFPPIVVEVDTTQVDTATTKLEHLLELREQSNEPLICEASTEQLVRELMRRKEAQLLHCGLYQSWSLTNKYKRPKTELPKSYEVLLLNSRVYSHIPWSIFDDFQNLTDTQKDQIKTAMVDHRPILVKGDPGPTGKTTLVDCLRSLGIQAFEPFEFEEINIEKG